MSQSQVVVEIPAEVRTLIQLVAERTALGVVRRFARSSLMKSRIPYIRQITNVSDALKKYRIEKNVYYDSKVKEFLENIAKIKEDMAKDEKVNLWSKRLETINTKIKEYGMDGETDKNGNLTGKIPKALASIGIDVRVLAVNLAKELNLE